MMNQLGLKRNSKQIGLFLVLILGIQISACSTGRSLRLRARDDFEAGRLNDAEKKLLSSDVVSESKSRLLTLVELGSVAHAKGEYEKSLRYFEKAKEMADRLFTKSISEQALTGILSDTSATYTGLDYEISMIHYYLVMNNLLLFQSKEVPAWEMKPLIDGGKVVIEGYRVDRRVLTPRESAEFFSHARSEVLAWDSFLELVKTKNNEIGTYRDDIGAKILAGFVHRMAGSNNDLTTARILYQNAGELLRKDYSLLPTFNGRYSELKKAVRNLSSTSADQLRALVAPTPYFENLDHFLKQSEQQIPNSDNNTFLVLESGMIPEKRAHVYNIGLGTLINAIEDPGLRETVTGIGVVALYNFAPQVLAVGMIEESIDQDNDRKNGVENEYSRDGARSINRGIDKAVGFRFKLPEIPRIPTDMNYRLVFSPTGSTNSGNKEFQLTVVNPINDFAVQEVDTKAAAIRMKTGIRVGIKYLIALVGAYQAYIQTKKSSGNEFLASLAASGAWMAGKKIADATESADIRAWNMLPQTLSFAEVKLDPGIYQVSAIGNRGAENWTFPLGLFEVQPGRKNIFKGKVTFSPYANSTRMK